MGELALARSDVVPLDDRASSPQRDRRAYIGPR